MLTAKDIYLRTMTFNWMKLMLGGATLVLSLILLAICAGLAWLFSSKDNGLAILIMLSVWLSGTKAINFILMHYFGYLVKAGHVAIISQAVTEGVIPDDQFNVAKKMVTDRFVTSNVYFALDKLVDGAVRQLGRTFDRVTNFIGLNNIPGFEQVQKLVKLFLHVALGYVDECCLGYTFYKKEQTPFKSAADGVVIYFQNWKVLLKNAAMTTLIVVGSTIGVTIVVGVVFGVICKLCGLPGLFGLLIGLMAAWAVKFAFIDSWILVSMMTTYMQVAPTTEITVDIYGKLCGLSAKFKELFNKGQAEQAAPPAAGPQTETAVATSADGFPPMEGGAQ